MGTPGDLVPLPLCELVLHRVPEAVARVVQGDELHAEFPEVQAAAAEAAMLSDALLRVYCVLRDVPDEEFGGEVSQRERYAHMGALLVAQEAANAEMERLTAQPA